MSQGTPNWVEGGSVTKDNDNGDDGDSSVSVSTSVGVVDVDAPRPVDDHKSSAVV